jgi:hypothetical protein
VGAQWPFAVHKIRSHTKRWPVRRPFISAAPESSIEISSRVQHANGARLPRATLVWGSSGRACGCYTGTEGIRTCPSSTERTRCAKLREHVVSCTLVSAGLQLTNIIVLLSPPRESCSR